MKIEELADSNFGLVYIKNGTPHCKKHGAMNKITKDGIWRCITLAGYTTVVVGNSVSKKHRENICRAGCNQIPTKSLLKRIWEKLHELGLTF